MKSLAHKLIAFTFVIAMAAGCGSVTDAGLDTQANQPEVTEPATQPDNPGFDGGATMDVIVDKPE